jgi:arylsulfatase A-like enzyme
MRRLLPFLLAFGCARPSPPANTIATVPVPMPVPVPVPVPVQPAATVPVKPAAPVVVILIIDQLASWVFEARRSSLAPDGAFAKLAKEGRYWSDLRYEHATTSTAPGHATLYTGLPPRGTGILANERLDETLDKSVSFFFDPATQLVQAHALEEHGSSGARLRAPTLADALRQQQPESLIVSLSLKDRAAIPGGGQKPDACVWFDPALATFVSSTAFHRQLPAFALAANERLADAWKSEWRPLDPDWLSEHAPTPDDQAGEGDFSLGIRFPYDLSKAKQRSMVFRGQPIADRSLLAMAEGALDELRPEREPERPFLLTLSLSSFDYVGHVHGPDSWESWEALRELDQALAVFIAGLERRFGSRLSLLLTADHGAGVLPETLGNVKARPWCEQSTPDAYERPCAAGERLYRADLEKRTKDAARDALGPGNWVRGVIEPFVYVTPELARLPEQQRRRFEARAIAALQAHPGIARVLSARQLAMPCPSSGDDSLDALVCRSVSADTPDLYIVPRPGSFFDPRLVHGHGINHGTPYLYDRRVPLFVRSASHAGAGRSSTQRLWPADFTATAAALLGISPPEGARSGRDLSKP